MSCLDAFYKAMCSMGHHDFVLVARWGSTDGSTVIREDHCTRCGEDAYSLDMFNPAECSVLKRYTTKRDAATVNSITEGYRFGKRICESGKKEASKQSKRASKEA